MAVPYMDDIDKKILKNLQQNARMTISDLSSEIALSMPAISERLKKLEASGVIKQYTVILDPAMLNKHLMALMFLRFDNPSHSDSFAAFVKDESEIKECFYTKFSYLIYIKRKQILAVNKDIDSAFITNLHLKCGYFSAFGAHLG